MTHGRGGYSRKFLKYEQMPPEAARAVIDEYAKHKKEEEEEA
jgi:hypothetical protein